MNGAAVTATRPGPTSATGVVGHVLTKAPKGALVSSKTTAALDAA